MAQQAAIPTGTSTSSPVLDPGLSIGEYLSKLSDRGRSGETIERLVDAARQADRRIGVCEGIDTIDQDAGRAPESGPFGLLPEPLRAPNGYRVYDDATLHRLRFIRTAQAAGLTLAEIHGITDIRDSGAAPCTHVDALLDAKLDEVRRRRRQLVELERELGHLVERSRRLDPADCTEGDICQILQSDTRTDA